MEAAQLHLIEIDKREKREKMMKKNRFVFCIFALFLELLILTIGDREKILAAGCTAYIEKS